MAVYAYKATDLDATTVSGTVAADTPRAARDLLRQRGLAVQDIAESRPRGPVRRSFWGRRAGAAQVTEFLRELSTLLTAGIPLLEAIDTLVPQYKGRFRGAVLALRERVAAGASLHEAMQEQPDLFDAICLSLCEVGHSTGTLEEALSRLAEYREKSHAARSRVVSALIYPAIVSLVGLAVTAFLMTFVVPNLLGTLKQAGRPLPLPTLIVQGASDFLVGWWWLLLAGLVGAAVASRLILRTSSGRARWDRWVLYIPLVGMLIRKETISRLAVVLATLLKSGLPFDQSLQITGRALKNRAFRSALARCERAVQAGADLATPLRESKIFPPAVVQIIAVGQRTGELEMMLDRLAGSYDQQVAIATARLTAAMEPLIIVVLAILVGFVAFATILPILEASNVF